MNKSKYLVFFWFFAISCFITFSCSESNKDSFADELTNDLIITFSKGYK